jgi:hypothetical protein
MGCLRKITAVAQRGALLAVIFLFCSCAEHRPTVKNDFVSHQNLQSQPQVWRGVHFWLDRESAAQELINTLPRLAAGGVNVVVVEVSYNFEFRAHPELRSKHFITRATAHALAGAARRYGVRLIPEFNCLGHQSFGHQPGPLLHVYPEFSEAPSLSLADANVYCLEWCSQASGLNKIIFSLIDEMADAFEADAFHVGMDEVYLIGSDECPRCHGKNPAHLFAAQINVLHAHIVGQRHLQMLMWADRVIGSKLQGSCKYDNARNDLSAAIDLIPRDIVMCDWHYEWKKKYPSVPFLTGKGFHVWPAGFLPLKAAQAFSDFSRQQTNTMILGWLATTWTETTISNSPDWPPIKAIIPRWQDPPK